MKDEPKGRVARHQERRGAAQIPSASQFGLNVEKKTEHKYVKMLVVIR